MTLSQHFEAWKAKRLPPPAPARAWSDGDLHAAFTEGVMAAVEALGGIEMMKDRARGLSANAVRVIDPSEPKLETPT